MPTAKRSGLWLSLTNDMFVRGRGGTIDIDTCEGDYTVLTIKLPIS